MTITTSPKSQRLADVEDPFSSLLIDATHMAGVEGPALRVELRRIRNPPGRDGWVPPEERIPDKSRVVGILNTGDLPKDNRVFKLHYHRWNGLMDFGTISTDEPIYNVSCDGDAGCFYFWTKEGQWRLKVLDAGN